MPILCYSSKWKEINYQSVIHANFLNIFYNMKIDQSKVDRRDLHIGSGSQRYTQYRFYQYMLLSANPIFSFVSHCLMFS